MCATPCSAPRAPKLKSHYTNHYCRKQNIIFKVLFIHINKFLLTWALSTDLAVLMLGPRQPHLLDQLFKIAKSVVYQLFTGYPDNAYQVSTQFVRLGLSPIKLLN